MASAAAARRCLVAPRRASARRLRATAAAAAAEAEARSSAAAAAARAPLPLLDPAAGYTHVSAGVCDACAASSEARRAWADLLLGQLPSHRANVARTAALPGEASAEATLASYAEWEAAYVEYLERAVEGPGDGPGATLLDMVVEKERLLRSHGLEDPFLALKQNENAVAGAMLPVVCAELDACAKEEGEEAALRKTVECCLAGNLFDAGAAAAVANMARSDDDGSQLPPEGASALVLNQWEVAATFSKTREQVARPPGGWRFDSFDRLAARAQARPWTRALLFCDNAGADTLGMVLLARRLLALSPDCKVALVANSTPALNDVTAADLAEFVAEGAAADGVLAAALEAGRLVMLPSGQDSTLLDLSRSGPELNAWVDAELAGAGPTGEWLVVLDGMGRSLESNWDAGRFFLGGVDVLSLAMVKSEINAARLGASVYDCVVRLSP